MIGFSKEELLVQALEKIFGRTVRANISNGLIKDWQEPNEVQPSKEQLDIEITRLVNNIPYEMLRRERDIRLAECDWRVSPDYPHADQPAWVEYRQKLRDLPQDIEDELLPKPTIVNDQLVFEGWPIPPN